MVGKGVVLLLCLGLAVVLTWVGSGLGLGWLLLGSGDRGLRRRVALGISCFNALWVSIGVLAVQPWSANHARATADLPMLGDAFLLWCGGHGAFVALGLLGFWLVSRGAASS